MHTAKFTPQPVDVPLQPREWRIPPPSSAIVRLPLCPVLLLKVEDCVQGRFGQRCRRLCTVHDRSQRKLTGRPCFECSKFLQYPIPRPKEISKFYFLECGVCRRPRVS